MLKKLLFLLVIGCSSLILSSEVKLENKTGETGRNVSLKYLRPDGDMDIQSHTLNNNGITSITIPSGYTLDGLRVAGDIGALYKKETVSGKDLKACINAGDVIAITKTEKGYSLECGSESKEEKK